MGIPVIFEEQNINSIYPESEFLITIHGAFAQSESEGISSRVKWGKHQAMRTGKANIQYKTLLGYEKGPDGEMVVNAEHSEVSAAEPGMKICPVCGAESDSKFCPKCGAPMD